MRTLKHQITNHQLIIAIDFDKTIDTGGFPEVGGLHKHVKEVINKWFAQGAYIIIWTCRTGILQLEAEAFLLKEGINFHKINDHHPNSLLNYGNDRQIDHNLQARKIWSHVLIDDTSINWMLHGHPGWSTLDSMLQLIIKNQVDSENPWTILPNFNKNYLTN
jgi:hypothetical protein